MAGNGGNGGIPEFEALLLGALWINQLFYGSRLNCGPSFIAIGYHELHIRLPFLSAFIFLRWMRALAPRGEVLEPEGVVQVPVAGSGGRRGCGGASG